MATIHITDTPVTGDTSSFCKLERGGGSLSISSSRGGGDSGDVDNGEDDMSSKMRGRSLLLGAKPKYMTKKKAMETGGRVVPLADDSLLCKAQEEDQCHNKDEEVPPEFSLDSHLQAKMHADQAEAQRKREEEKARIAKDMATLGGGGGNGRAVRRESVLDQLRQSFMIQNKDPEAMSEEDMAEMIGSTFHSMWDKLGVASQFVGKVKDDFVSAHAVHPLEVLERTACCFPHRKYVATNYKMAELKQQKSGTPSPSASSETPPSDLTDPPPLPSDSEAPKKLRRGGMRNLDSKNYSENPFEVLALSQDELDYFYGFFCAVAGAKADEDPVRISLKQFAHWMTNHSKSTLKKDNVVLKNMIKTLHYFDEAVVARGNSSQGSAIAGLLQGAESPKTKAPKTKEQEEASSKVETETQLNANTDNISLSAKDIGATPKSAKIAEVKSAPVGEYFDEFVTFPEFVLSMWNFLSADETVLIRTIFEFIEVGLLGLKEGRGLIPYENAVDLGQIWHPKSTSHRKCERRKKDRVKPMVDAMRETW